MTLYCNSTLLIWPTGMLSNPDTTQTAGGSSQISNQPSDIAYGQKNTWYCCCSSVSVTRIHTGCITIFSMETPDHTLRDTNLWHWCQLFLPSHYHRAAWHCWWPWQRWAASAPNDQQKAPTVGSASCLWFPPVPAGSHRARCSGPHSPADVLKLTKKKTT